MLFHCPSSFPLNTIIHHCDCHLHVHHVHHRHHVHRHVHFYDHHCVHHHCHHHGHYLPAHHFHVCNCICNQLRLWSGASVVIASSAGHSLAQLSESVRRELAHPLAHHDAVPDSEASPLSQHTTHDGVVHVDDDDNDDHYDAHEHQHQHERSHEDTSSGDVMCIIILNHYVYQDDVSVLFTVFRTRHDDDAHDDHSHSQ